MVDARPSAVVRRRNRGKPGKWRQMYDALVRFKAEHGHLNVPCSDLRYMALSSWIYSQRSLRRKGQLSAARLSALTDIGFSWGVPVEVKRANREHWLGNLARLDQFKAEHGHVRVPTNRAEVTPLRSWLSNQTALMRAGKMSPSRVKLLKEAGVAA